MLERIRIQTRNTQLPILYVLGMVLIGICADNGWLNKWMRVAESQWPMYDQFLHFLLFGLLAMFAQQFYIKRFGLNIRKVLGVALVLLLLASVDEFSQIYREYRSFSLLDLSANYLGITGFSALVYGYYKRKNYADR